MKPRERSEKGEKNEKDRTGEGGKSDWELECKIEMGFI